MNPQNSNRYTVISADCHGGGSHEQYREYLPRRWLDEFDDWRRGFASPWRDLEEGATQADQRVAKKARNWDRSRRWEDNHAEGVVAEIVYPNTTPPFFPTNNVIAPTPSATEFERRFVGVQAHNRWLADWIGQDPLRRRSMVQVFLNDLDAAVDEIRWGHANGLTGGILLPGVSPDSTLPPLFDSSYDPIWRVCEELGMVVNHHGGGTGIPDYGNTGVARLNFIMETPFWAQRAVWHLIWGGVFERFPNLRFVLAEVGIKFVPELLARMDQYHGQMSSTHRIGEVTFEPDEVLPNRPSEYFRRNVYVGSAFPAPSDAAVIREIGLDRVMWGSDYPHDEAVSPYAKESLRRTFEGWAPKDLQQVLAGTAAHVYDFDLDALAPFVAQHGPTHAEIAIPLEAIPDSRSPAFTRN